MNYNQDRKERILYADDAMRNYPASVKNAAKKHFASLFREWDRSGV